MSEDDQARQSVKSADLFGRARTFHQKANEQLENARLADNQSRQQLLLAGAAAFSEWGKQLEKTAQVIEQIEARTKSIMEARRPEVRIASAQENAHVPPESESPRDKEEEDLAVDSSQLEAGNDRWA